MNKPFLTAVLLGFFTGTFGQPTNMFADSIRVKYNIPELAYAVVSSDSILEIKALGVQRVNTDLKAGIHDQFRLGSNTKPITSYLCALAVKQGKLNWDTIFFDLYPELKANSDSAYYDLTLQDLLSFRAKLIRWSYGDSIPTKEDIKGNNQEQRYEFMAWVLQQDPVTEQRTIYWSNPSYVAAGMMLEKATGKTYEDLVNDLGKELGIRFGFGQPNVNDKNQPWGHDGNAVPEEPAVNYKLNWLSPAGNVNVSLPGYCRFVQVQLAGLAGRSKLLTAQEFEHMHYGLPEFAFGWGWFVDDITKFTYSFHQGNPGTFLTKTFICKDTGLAFIVFANIQSDEAERGLMILLGELRIKYGS